MWPALFVVALAAGSLIFFLGKKQREEDRKSAAAREDALRRQLAEQKQASDRFQAQQETLFNSMAEGLLVLDEQGRIQYANHAVEALMEANGNLRGKTILEAFRLHALSDLAARLADSGQVRGFELSLPGLRPRILQVNAALIRDERGQPRGSLLIFHDLTRLKELENTRKEFVANVSHELRTPLSLIKGYVETLIDGAKDDPVVASRFLQTIEKHADRLAYLIEDLLTISQLESGQSVMNMQTVNLHAIVIRVLEDLKSKAAEKSTRLENEIPEEMLIHGDGDRLEQVLLNLVDNGLKYGRVGGTVRVAATEIEGKIRVSVSDDGPGIPPEALERVFERFYRVDRARSRDQGGTGLGLSIVKHIIQSHGGEAWAESEPGKGATFFFTVEKA